MEKIFGPLIEISCKNISFAIVSRKNPTDFIFGQMPIWT
jgi:hypothetical protein